MNFRLFWLLSFLFSALSLGSTGIKVAVAIFPDYSEESFEAKIFIQHRLKNLREIASKANRQGVDLLILPEFLFVPQNVLSRRDEAIKYEINSSLGFEAFRDIRDISVGSEIAIAVNIPELNEGKLYNSNYIIQKDGGVSPPYRKINPFFKKTFAAGSADQGGKLININGVNVTFMVCYDVLFSQPSSRIRHGLDGEKADLVISPVASGSIDFIFKAAHRIWSRRNSPFILAVADMSDSTSRSISRFYRKGRLLADYKIPLFDGHALLVLDEGQTD